MMIMMYDKSYFIFSSAEELEGKVKSLANFERLQELQNCLVWPSIIELDPKTYVPEVRMNNRWEWEMENGKE